MRTARLAIGLAVLLGAVLLPPASVSATGAESYAPFSTNIFSGPSTITLPDTSTLIIANTPAIAASSLDTAHTYTWTLYTSPGDSGTYSPIATIVRSGSATQTLQFPGSTVIQAGTWGAWQVLDDLGAIAGRGLYAPPPTTDFWDVDSPVIIGPLAYCGESDGTYLHSDEACEGSPANQIGINIPDSLIYWREHTVDTDCDTITLPSGISGASITTRRIFDATSGGSVAMEDVLEYITLDNYAALGGAGLDLGYLRLYCKLGFVAYKDINTALKSPEWDVDLTLWSPSVNPMWWDMSYGVYQYVYDVPGTDVVGNGLLPIMRNTPETVISVNTPYTNRAGSDARLVLESIYEPEFWTDLSDNAIQACGPSACVLADVDTADYLFTASRIVSISGIGAAGDTVDTAEIRFSDTLPYGNGGLTARYWGYTTTAAYVVGVAATLVSGTQDAIANSSEPDAMAVGMFLIIALGLGAVGMLLSPGLAAVAIFGAAIIGVTVFSLSPILLVLAAFASIILVKVSPRSEA